MSIGTKTTFLHSPTIALCWLGFTALFEVPMLKTIFEQGASVANPLVMANHQQDYKGQCSDAYSRIYFLWISILAVSRVCIMLDYKNRGLWMLGACIHVMEAIFFWTEAYKAPGGLAKNCDPILIIILIQAIWFALFAMKVNNNHQIQDASSDSKKEN